MFHMWQYTFETEYPSLVTGMLQKYILITIGSSTVTWEEPLSLVYLTEDSDSKLLHRVASWEISRCVIRWKRYSHDAYLLTSVVSLSPLLCFWCYADCRMLMMLIAWYFNHYFFDHNMAYSIIHQTRKGRI